MPLPEPKRVVVQAARSAGAGYTIPERNSDCSGVRPSWFPFQVNVCDEDGPDPDPVTPTRRHRTTDR